MSTWFIYLLRFPSGKVYIGQTNRTVEARCRAHIAKAKNNAISILYSAIRKYDFKFTAEILSSHCSLEATNLAEIEAIRKFNSTDRANGYNMRLGGQQGGAYTQEIRQKLKDAFNTDTCRRKRSDSWAQAREIRVTTLRESAQRRAKRCPIVAFSIHTGVLKFDKLHEAAATLSLDRRAILQVLKGKCGYHKGFTFKYADQIDSEESFATESRERVTSRYARMAASRRRKHADL